MPKMFTHRKCIICGKIVLLPRAAKYCSSECRKKAEANKRNANREVRLKKRREAYKNRKKGISNKYVMKACSNCGKIVRMYASGQSKYCVSCRKLTGKIYRKAHPDLHKKDYKANISWYRQYNKKYYENNKETINKSNREYYQKNRIRILLKNREYFIEHRDEKLQYHKDYHRKNWEWMKEKYKDKRKAYRQTEECKLIMAAVRQNRRTNGWKKLTVDEIKKVQKKNEKKYGELSCCYCQTPFRKLMNVTKVIQSEHLIPLSRGGMHTIRNLDFACIFCNASKGTMKKSEYLRTDRFIKTCQRVRNLVREYEQ